MGAEAGKWAIIADGEGAQACVIADGDLHEAVHKFMCVCGKPWRDCECGPQMVCDISLIDNPDAWTTDEAGKAFSVSWPHETGKITLYRVSAELPKRPMVGLQQLLDAGLNAFGLQLFVESVADKKDAATSLPFTFSYKGILVTLAPDPERPLDGRHQ